MDGRKEVEALVREAKSKGWVVERTAHGYVIAPPDDPKDFVSLGSTPSETRGLRNVMSRLRRRGWDNGNGRPKDQSEEIASLNEEVEGLKEERASLLKDKALLLSTNEELSRNIRGADKSVRRATAELNQRDVSISKLKGQVENWRQEAHSSRKLLGIVTGVFLDLLKEMGVVPTEGEPLKDGEAATKKWRQTAAEAETLSKEFEDYTESVRDALDEVGAPRVAIREGKEVRLMDEERIRAVSGGADAGALRLKLESVMAFFEEQATGEKGMVADIRKTLEAHS